MLKLAEKYAKLKKTKVLDHKVYDDKIVFVLESGPKLTMTEAELKTAIEKMSASAEETPAPPPAESPAERKARLKAEREAKKQEQ